MIMVHNTLVDLKQLWGFAASNSEQLNESLTETSFEQLGV